jgi:hypothetical protein
MRKIYGKGLVLQFKVGVQRTLSKYYFSSKHINLFLGYAIVFAMLFKHKITTTTYIKIISAIVFVMFSFISEIRAFGCVFNP